MTLRDIATLLDDRFGSSPILLTDALLTELQIDTFLAETLPDGTFELLNAQHQIADGTLTITAQATLLGTTGTATATIEELGPRRRTDAVKYRLDVTLPLPADWSFSTAWDVIEDSALLSSLALSQPKLQLASRRLGKAGKVRKGLNLFGRVALEEAFEEVAAIVGLDSGPIRCQPKLVGDKPKVVVEIALGSVELGDARLDNMAVVLSQPLTGDNPRERDVFKGILKIAGQKIPIKAEVPSPDAVFTTLVANFARKPIVLGGLDDLAGILGGSDAAAAVPDNLIGDLALTRVELILARGGGLEAASLKVSSSAVWSLGGLGDIRELSLTLGVRALSSTPRWSAQLGGVVVLGDARLDVDVSLPDGTVSCALEDGQTMDLTGALSSIGVPTDGLPLSAGVTNFSLLFTPATRDIDLQVDLSTSWGFDVGGTSFALTDVSLSYGSGAIGIMGGFDIGGRELLLRSTGGGGGAWQIEGELPEGDPVDLAEGLRDIMPSELEIPEEFLAAQFTAARISFDTSGGSFDLSLDGTVEVGLDDLAQLHANRIALSYAREGSGSSWSLDFEGGIEAGPIDISGTLSAAHSGTSTELKFIPAPGTADLEFDLPLPDAPTLSLALKWIELTKRPTGSWVVGGEATAVFGNLEGLWDDLIPDHIDASVTVLSDGLRISVSNLVDWVDVELPDIPFPTGDIDLGEVAVHLGDFSFDTGSNASVSAQLDLGLPSKLNHIFGTTDGQPNITIFRTYDAGNQVESSFRLSVSASSNGLSLRPLNSPIVAMETEERDGRLWWVLDMGEVGAADIAVPDFAYQPNGGFLARGGFDIVRPLGLPLTPVQSLFNAAGLDAVSGIIPDRITFDSIGIMRDGHLDTDVFAALFGDNPPSAVQDAIGLLAGAVDRLPDALHPYLEFEIPESLLFDIEVNASGAVKFALEVEPDDGPLRVLWPGLVGPLPGLYGLQLRRLSFGEILGGQLFLFEIDGQLDLFDIITLAAAVILPLDQIPLLPDPQQAHARFLMSNVYGIIVYQTVIPIPIPIFYDNLGLEYSGIEGVGLQGHLRFPNPAPTLAEQAALLAPFLEFVIDPSYLLDASSPPNDAELAYTIGPTFAQTPQYLGDVTLGEDGDVATLDVWSSVAHLLNALKTFRIDEFLAAIPLQYRVGAATSSLFGIQLDGAWALTTPTEFRDVAYTRLDIDAADREGVLAVLPTEDADEGLVVLLRGGLQVGSIAGFQGTTGLVASNASGFATGIQVLGRVAVVDVELSGVVIVDPAGGTPFLLQGRSHLGVAGATVLEGTLSQDDRGLTITGTLDLFPGIDIVTASGEVSGYAGRDGFDVHGDMHLAVGGVTLVRGAGAISDSGVWIDGQYLGANVRFELSVDGADTHMSGRVDVSVGLSGTLGPIRIAGVTVADGFTIDTSVGVGFGMGISRDGFSATANAHVQLPALPRFDLNFTVSIVPSTIGDLASRAWDALVDQVEDFFRTLFTDPAKWLQMIGEGVITLVGDAAEVIGRALDQAFDQTAEAATALLKDAGHTAEEVGRALGRGFGIAGDAIGSVMKDAGYIAHDVGKALVAGVGSTIDDAAGILRDAGYTVTQVGSALRGTFTDSAEDAARALRGVGYIAEDAAAAIKGTFTDSVSVAGQALKNAGYTAAETAKGLRDGFEAGAEDVAEVLGDAFDLGGEAATAVLEGAGYAAGEVASAVEDFFDWVPHVKLPHVKHVKLPHVKHVKLPHVKHVKVPHVKHVKVPHVKHVKVPHVKHVKVPHVKHVKLPHVKVF